MGRSRKLAALGAQEGQLVVWLEGRTGPRRLSDPLAAARSIAYLFERMRALDVGILYVHATALGLLGLPAQIEVPEESERRPPHPWVQGVRIDGELVSQRALAPSTQAAGMEVLIGAYQSGAGDPFADALDGGELLAATIAFREAFVSTDRPSGWCFSHSAAVTGWNLMHTPWRYGRRKGKLHALGFDENELPPSAEGGIDAQQVEVPYGSWAPGRRPAKAKRLPFTLAWDVNGQRLAACARLKLGVGGLERRDGADFDKTLPGYHLVSKIEDRFRGAIPPIMTPGWHTTPRVAMAIYLGLRIELARSWVWTKHVPYLDPFYDAMRQARSRLMNAYRIGRTERMWELALGAVKQAYLQPLGRLRSSRAREQHDLLYRPHWYDSVIGQELAREYLRLHQLADAGVPVRAVYYDTIVVESASEDPVAGAPAQLVVSDQLGKYKPLGQLPTEQAIGLLYSRTASQGGPDVLALIKALRDSPRPDPAPIAKPIPVEPADPPPPNWADFTPLPEDYLA